MGPCLKPMIVGSRGSPLALAQTRGIVAELKRKWPGQNFEIHVIKTEGDRLADLSPVDGESLGKGLFTGELERSLLDGKIDLAVHSLKDLPTTGAEGLMLAAIPKRSDARDVLITREDRLGQDLPYGAIIATGSPRRAAQLCLIREDLVTVGIRGNIDTRLRKFRENAEWYGILLAAAGLERLKPDMAGLSEMILPYEQMLPAPGQGALALQTRKEKAEDIRHLVGAVHDPETAAAVAAERMFLHALGGGCREPIAAYAEVLPDELLRLEGIAWLIGETKPRRGHLTRRLDQAEVLGVDLAVEISR
jgi:hydroxymethylbilane synthase